MNTTSLPCIGILGGSGPLATAHLHGRFLNSWQSATQAVEDIDFPSLRVHQCPEMGLDWRGAGASAPAKLRQGLESLREAGAQIQLIACNTLHAHLSAEDSPGVWSLVRAATAEAQRLNCPRVAVWCSQAAEMSEVYSKALAARGLIHQALPGDIRALVDQMIRSAMGGHAARALDALRQALRLTRESGAQTLILGCTELPLITQRAGWDALAVARKNGLWVVDAGEAAVQSLVRQLQERRFFAPSQDRPH